MAQGAGRIVCPRCGANNFDTVMACWKCSTPLSASPTPGGPAPPRASSPAAPPVALGSPPVHDRGYQGPAAAQGSPALSNRAAFWLGILFPYFGLPIALAFMMCDDRRRQEVGRICLLWSLVSGFVHVVLLLVTVLGLKDYAQFAFRLAGQAARRGAGGGYGSDGL